jgi:hypothetical protein
VGIRFFIANATDTTTETREHTSLTGVRTMKYIKQTRTVRAALFATGAVLFVGSPVRADHGSKTAPVTHAPALSAEAQAEIEEQRVVGRWLHPIMGIYLIKKYSTGYALIIEPGTSKPGWFRLRQHLSKRGLRLDAIDSDYGDCFIILPDGRLLIGDREGDVETLEPAKGGSTEAHSEELAQLRSDIACSTDVDCVAQNNIIVDTAICKDAIQGKARWDYEWTGSALIFSSWHFNPHRHTKDGIVDYYGDSLRFQNGFGAWMNMVYRCTVDTKNNTVVKVSAAPGHLQN